MTITRLTLHPVVSERHYTTRIAKPGRQLRPGVEKSNYLILELSTDDGLTGWGEASDLNRWPDLEAIAAQLKSVLVGESPFNIERIHLAHDAHVSIRCAVDLVCHDLMGKAVNQPVYNLLGGRLLDRVLASWVVYIRDAENLADELQEKVDQGFRAFKMKVGADLDLDERRLQVFREVVGPDAEIKLDANGAWDVEGAVTAMSRLEKYDVAGIETPIPATNVDDMVRVKNRIGVSYIEHGGPSARHLEMIQKRAVDAFKISVNGRGGLRGARTVATTAAMGDIACYVGSTVEMGPGTAAGIHFAASTANTDHYGADLRGPLLLKDDVLTTPIDYTDGYLHVPNGPGLGVEVDRARLESLRANIGAP